MGSRLLAVAATAGMLAGASAVAAESPERFAVPAAKAKKCKAKQVRVTVGKRRKVCRPLARFIPRPRAGDSRRIGVEAALGLELGRVGGKRVPGMASVLGKRRAAAARRKLLKLLPILLRRVDARGSARAAANADDCGVTGPNFSDNTNGGSIGLSGGNGQMTAPAGGGYRVRVTFPAGNCNSYRVDTCPTAAGVVEGKATLPRDIHVVIYEGDALVLNQSYRTTEKVTFKGQVADDAKLNELEIDDSVNYHFSAGGGSGPHVLVDATIARSTTVNMRTGRYVPRDAAVRVLFRVNGRSAGPEEDLRQGASLAARFAADFADMVDTAIRIYRSSEEHWNGPNNCAKLEFSPAAESLTLSRDQTGSVSATVSAAGGGSPPTAKWTVNAPQNATFSPLQSSANPFSASYTVTNAGAGIKVSAGFHATSRAGVVEQTWSQPTSGVPNHISGSWHSVIHNEGLTWNIGFDSAYDRVPSSTPSLKGEYDLVSNSGTWSVSGLDPDTGCNLSGSGSFTVGGGGAMLYTLGNATPGPPFEYLIQTQATDSPATYNYSACPDSDMDGPVERTAPFSGLNLSGTSPDGAAFNGSETDTSSGYSREDTWTLTGTP